MTTQETIEALERDLIDAEAVADDQEADRIRTDIQNERGEQAHCVNGCGRFVPFDGAWCPDCDATERRAD